MYLTRRNILVFTTASVALPAIGIPRRGDASALGDALDSTLVYLSPLKEDGTESTCHGEVWFVVHDGSMFVSTRTGAWRAENVRNGNELARLWVGEHGVWTEAGDKFKDSPSFVATAEYETDKAVQAAVLAKFGEKYSSGWGKWGPRFKQGLESGARVLLKYSRVENGHVVPIG